MSLPHHAPALSCGTHAFVVDGLQSCDEAPIDRARVRDLDSLRAEIKLIPRGSQVADAFSLIDEEFWAATTPCSSS